MDPIKLYYRYNNLLLIIVIFLIIKGMKHFFGFFYRNFVDFLLIYYFLALFDLIEIFFRDFVLLYRNFCCYCYVNLLLFGFLPYRNLILLFLMVLVQIVPILEFFRRFDRCINIFEQDPMSLCFEGILRIKLNI